MRAYALQFNRETMYLAASVRSKLGWTVLMGLLFAAFGVWGCSDNPMSSPDPDPDPDLPAPCSMPDPQGCWKTYATAPTKRQEIQPALLEDKIYLVGGLSGASFADVQVGSQ